MVKRIEFTEYGGPEVLSFCEYTPAPLGPDEIRIENYAIGVNYIDTYVRNGLYPTAQFPSGLGTEAAGVVVKTGAHVLGF